MPIEKSCDGRKETLLDRSGPPRAPVLKSHCHFASVPQDLDSIEIATMDGKLCAAQLIHVHPASVRAA